MLKVSIKTDVHVESLEHFAVYFFLSVHFKMKEIELFYKVASFINLLVK